MDVRIKTSGYENIYFDCPFCNYENVLNRVSDLLGIDVIARHEDVFCIRCKKKFSIIGDEIVFASYEWFINDLDMLKDKKMYRQYVLNLCQGLEMFFHQAIINKKFDRNPKFRYKNGELNDEKYKKEINEYLKSINTFTFNKMREVFLQTFKKEQDNYLQLKNKSEHHLQKEYFDLIKKTKIDTLRNRVVHKEAYRPSLEEINEYDHLIDAIDWVRSYLDIEDSIDILNESFLSS